MTTTTADAAAGPLSRLLERIYRFRLLYILAATTFLLDQASKFWIANLSGLTLGDYPPRGGIEIIPGVFNIVYAVNFGAAWGILEGKAAFLLVVAVAFIVLIYVVRRSLELHRPAIQLIFGCIIGGILGNAIDRLIHGYVIDFLDFHLQIYHWPTFNFADTFIVSGTAAYLLISVRDTARETKRSAEKASPQKPVGTSTPHRDRSGKP